MIITGNLDVLINFSGILYECCTVYGIGVDYESRSMKDEKSAVGFTDFKGYQSTQVSMTHVWWLCAHVCGFSVRHRAAF